MGSHIRAVELDATTTVRVWCRTGAALQIREAGELSQAELAELAGTTSSNVSRWENGQRTPRGQHAVRYHRALVHLGEITVTARVGSQLERPQEAS